MSNVQSKNHLPLDFYMGKFSKTFDIENFNFEKELKKKVLCLFILFEIYLSTGRLTKQQGMLGTGFSPL